MIILFRIIFIVSSVLFSVSYFINNSILSMVIAAVVASVASLIFIIFVEYFIHTFSSRVLLAAIFGLIIGFILSYFLSMAIFPFGEKFLGDNVKIVGSIIFHLVGFAVMMFFVVNNEDFGFFDKVVASGGGSNLGKIQYKILDTSVIIDGRISDICDTGFIEGVLVIPTFVLNELQLIADSADSIKRNRGRRGLDILNKMQKDQSIKVKISDMDFADIHEVDAKLVKLAKVMDAKVVTNDFNLNKVAEFHGVTVLNINQLSNALKPIVLPGEEMHVSLVKEGKDQSQAIGYLDDGTMVVVENGRPKLGSDVDVVVTSVLQTTAGRMIFARLKED